MDFDKSFSIEDKMEDYNDLFKHYNINYSRSAMSVEAEDEIPEPPEVPDFEAGGGDNDGGSESPEGGDNDDDSSDDGDSSGGDGDSDNEIEQNTSPNPLANINGRQRIYDQFLVLRESISDTIETLNLDENPMTVEMSRLNDLLDLVSKNMECVFTQPINESLLLFGAMTRHYSNIIDLINKKRDYKK